MERLSGQLRGRRALLLLAAALALSGVLGGLARVGVAVSFGPSMAVAHGPLLVLGVFGAVISLERAVALGRGWAFVAPALATVGAVAAALGLSGSAWVLASSCAVMVLVNAAVVRRQAAAFTWLMLLGSLLLFGGAWAWAAGAPVSAVTPAWLGFFVLTIVAERLELSRLAPTPRWASRALWMLSVVFAAAAFAQGWWPTVAAPVFGACLVLLGAWQLRFDLARRTARLAGVPRFTAAGVLSGAAWLVVTGVVLLARGAPPAGPVADAVLHGVFVGYVLSMVFAHALVILPAVARVAVPYHPLLFAPLVLLHGGLVVRVVGDLAALPAVRQVGAVLNALALALFVVAVVAARWLTARPVAPRPRPVTDAP
ncbi:MAG: hypothetical protein IAE78_22755 [Myxococcus sp.]|nr:hypothetical protein [Myxococcus sp.]